MTDSYGIMDTSINNDEKSNSSHTLSIESTSRSVDSTVRYAFVHGSCKITSLSLPEPEGVFSFKVFHSRHPELHMNLKVEIIILKYVRRKCMLLIASFINFQIQLTSAQTSERDDIGSFEPYPRIYLTPQSKFGSTTNPWVTPTQQTPSSQSQFRLLSIREMSSAISSQTAPVDMAQLNDYTEVCIDHYPHFSRT